MSNFKSGDLLGPYQIISQIGKGGMAIVYKAFHPAMDRYVAVKVMSHELLEDERALKRFQQEVRLLAQLQHPNILPVYDYGEFENVSYLVMRLLEGGNLKDRIRTGALSINEIDSYFDQLARALECAHEKGVIHRDVKPSNVLMDEKGDLFLADFGIAQLEQVKTRLTATGTSTGTPAYMSPEQAQGKKVDQRADIYSLGVVLYEMLTGRLPFEADVPVALIFKKLSEPVLAPSNFNPSISPVIDDVVLTALAIDPEERFSKITDFSTAWKQALSYPPDKTFKKNKVRRPRTSKPVSRWLMGGAVLGSLIIIALLSVVIFQGNLFQTRVTPSISSLVSENNINPTEIGILAQNQLLSSPSPIPTISIFDRSFAGPVPNRAWARLGKGTIKSIAISSQTNQLVIGSSLGIYFYQVNYKLQPPLELLRFENTGAAVSSLSFTPDGTTLAIGLVDHTTLLWDINNAKYLRTIKGHSKLVTSVCFSPDGAILASGSLDDTVMLWNVSNGVLLNTLKMQANGVYQMVCSPDGKTLASGSGDGTIILWDYMTGEQIKAIKAHSGLVNSLAFSPDGSLLISVGAKEVKVWNGHNGGPIRTLPDNLKVGGVVAFSPDGKTLTINSAETAITLRDTNTWEEIRSLIVSGSDINNLAFSTDPATLVSSSESDLSIWDLNRGDLLYKLLGFTGEVNSIAFSPDGSILASGSGDNSITLWDINKGEQLRSLKGQSQGIRSVAYSPDGNTLASGAGDNTIVLWDPKSGESLHQLDGDKSPINCVVFSPDGGTLATGSYDGNISLWNMDSNQKMHDFKEHTGSINSLAFSPDGRFLASGSRDKTVIIWELVTEKPIHILAGNTDWVRSLAFSPDGKVLASGSDNGTIILWNTITGEQILTLEGHQGPVTSLQYLSKNNTLISGSYDSTLILWDVETGKMIETLQGQTQGIESLSISPDGGLLAAGSLDGTIILWHISTKE